MYNWSTINANNRAPKESHWSCQVMTVMSPSKKKIAVVALSKWKMDCRFRKLSPLSCQLLSAVGTLVTNCRHILTQCRLSLKPLGRPHMYNRNVIFLSRWWTFHTQIHVHLSCGLPTWQATLFQISKCKYAVKIQHGEKVSLFWQTILTSGYQSFKCLNHPQLR